MSKPTVPQKTERIQPIVRVSTADWIRLEAARARLSQGEVIDRLIEEASRSRRDRKNG